MRKLAIALVLPLFLAGCTPPAEVFDQVQKQAQKLCGFIPSVSMIGSVIASFFPGASVSVSAASAVATKVCEMVKDEKQGLVSPPVKVEGWFVGN